MKRILFILTLVLISIGGNLQANSKKATCLYFCISRSLKPFESTGKIRILYSDLREIDCAEDLVKAKSREWAVLANSMYPSPFACTSDLNYYPDLESAKKEFDKLQVRYRDTSNYILKRLDF